MITVARKFISGARKRGAALLDGAAITLDVLGGDAAGNPRARLGYRSTHLNLVSALKKSIAGRARAMEQAIGGEFEAMGIMEREILIQHGLRKGDYVIDVGCGSGRLAKPLSDYLEGQYLGIDVVPDLLAHAQTLVDRPNWRFLPAPGLTIPESAGRADVVCFFSVFTHLLHEQSFAYLKEAKRVLRPTGKIIFSFLEFAIPNHWAVFERNIAAIGTLQPLNQFMSRDGIGCWAAHLGLKIEAIYDGDKPHTPLPKPLVLLDGQRFESEGNLGQSVCVMSIA
jgi:ubiquinone/menaquinone biosynthesis C-methylase UbiE